MRRRDVLSLACSAFAWPLVASAQTVARVVRIGFLHPGSAAHANQQRQIALFRSGLSELGWVEGQSFVVESRWADGKNQALPQLAAELVASGVDIIVTGGAPAIRASKQATSTVPIVMAITGDAVSAGFVQSLARPGGNITGTSYLDPELTAKRLEILKESIPRLSRMAALVNPENPQAMGSTIQALRQAAKDANIDLIQYEIPGRGDFDKFFAAMPNDNVQAVAVVDDSYFIANFRAIAERCAKMRLPSVGAKEFAEAGGFIGYGVDFQQVWHRAAYFVDKILKGSHPSIVPSEQVTLFSLAINMKTAKHLELTVPRLLLERADTIIE